MKQAIRKLPGRTKMPWYLTAPSASQSCLPVFDGLDAGTVFGPVHDVDETLEGGGHMSVLVPPPLSLVPPAYRASLPELVWVNIYTNRNGGRWVSHHFCIVVPEPEVREWRACGWYDIWVPSG